MNFDDQLNRLFRAASATRSDLVSEPPYGLETRVLAAWRAAEVPTIWRTDLLIKGLIVAGVVMALSFLPLLDKAPTPESEYLQLADSTLQVDNL